jgi:replication initiation protein RepC
MHPENVATPFGRRQVSLAAIRRQSADVTLEEGAVANKWKILQAVSTAIEKFELQPNSVAVLNALLSFYPETDLRQGAQMIVFPSNVQLSLRAHGMAGATMRRHLAALVDAGLITRRDSANGKRFARKNAVGKIQSAFGFDLSPLLVRAKAIAKLASDVENERAILRHKREDLTVIRRDVRKLITAALLDGLPGDWTSLDEAYREIAVRIPRSPSLPLLNEAMENMVSLRAEVLNRLEILDNDNIGSSSDAPDEQHIQNSNTESQFEFTKADKGVGTISSSKPSSVLEPAKEYPLNMILRACPSVSDYGPGGRIQNWRDLLDATSVIRSTLGITPSAYADACAKMGHQAAAISVACILQRAPLIHSAGGYLRDLTRKAVLGRFSVGPMLNALLHAGLYRASDSANRQLVATNKLTC